MMNEKATAEKLLQINAIKLSPQQPFTWASGWKSPIYCDNRKVLSFPFSRDFIKSEMCNVVFEQFPGADILAGVGTAGIPWGAMVSDQLKLPYIYVRPKPKEHGLGNQIEGNLTPGQKILVVEDLISTGGSSIKAVNALRDGGLDVKGLAAIFTYGFKLAEENFSKAECPILTLTDYAVLIEQALNSNYISQDDLVQLQSWRENPSIWMQEK
jgi:orotate phosphoribosyltransferase